MSRDPTLDPARRSFVESANAADADFPIQNLPFGRFRRRGSGEAPRLGVAIGTLVLDLRRAVEAKLLNDAGGEVCCALCAEDLNAFLALGRPAWTAARRAIARLLDAEQPALRDLAHLRAEMLVPQAQAEMLVPARIGDYTDFYCSIHHATNVGSMFRPDNPLLPNYKHLPIGYHGRASSIVIDGTPVRRPHGQVVPVDGQPPVDEAVRLLDYELELGFLVGPGNALGERIPMDQARDRIFGLVLVNDWSARDVQKWEYQPLGPFNAKNFATTISPWVVTLDALDPFRVEGPPRGIDDPPMLPYLRPTEPMGLAIELEVAIRSAAMREQGIPPHVVSRGGFADMYWTIAQMLVHHASTGCNLRPGDLIASGTVSGTTKESRGCLLERTWRGAEPIALPDGTQRKFLQDGDEVIMRGWCAKDGATRIGFGACRGIVVGGAA